MNTKHTETLKIEGMSCGHCVGAVEAALRKVPGVQVHDVNIGLAQVSYDPNGVYRNQLVQAVEEEGYTVQ